MKNHELLKQVEEELENKFIEREEEISIILTSLVANTNCQFIGAPGTGKSALAQGVADLLNCNFFKVNMDENLDPDFVIGTISLAKMRDEDIIVRNTKGKISDSHLAFLDEVNKCNSAMRNALLLPLNERKVDIGDGAPKDTLIRCVIGASNEYPNCTSLDDDTSHLVNDPNWDRWALRYQNMYIKSDSNFERLLNERHTIGIVDSDKAIDLSVLDEMRSACDQVDTSSIIPVILDLRTELRKEGIVLSDRRWMTLCRLISARAVMRGDSSASTADLSILQHGLWRVPEERVVVKNVLFETIGNEVGDAMATLVMVKEEVSKLDHISNEPSNIPQVADMKAKLSTCIIDAGSKTWSEPEALEIKKEIAIEMTKFNDKIKACMNDRSI